MWKRDESEKPSNAPQGGAPGEQKRPDKVVMDLGKSVRIKGELSASEDLTIYGQMEGKITLPDNTLTIGPHADIKAGIAARSVVIIGAVTGNITAGERIEIQSTGAVTGDVSSPRLAMAEGGCLSGKVQMPASPTPRAGRSGA